MKKINVKFHKKEDYNKTQGVLIVILLLIVFITNSIFYIIEYNNKKILKDDSNIAQKIGVISDILEKNYLFMDEVPDEQIVDGTIKGYVASLGDPYTRYISYKEYEEFAMSIAGEFSGIGVTIQNPGNESIPEEGMTVVDLSEGKGAETAGVEKNDKIVEVDGKSIIGMSYEDAIDMIKGKEGTDVSLKVVKESGETKEIKVTREKIEYPNVSAEVVNDNIGYIYISKFSQNIVEQFDKAYEKIKDDSEMLIIDLRNNVGGSLPATVELLGRFLPENSVAVKIEKKNFETEYKTQKQSYSIDKPVVVLINQYSASASEIFASALRDNNRAKLIGQKTYGKGLVQETKQIDDHSLQIVTISKYLTPNGEDINNKGISPDIEVIQDMQSMEDMQFNRAIKFLTEGE